MDGLASIADVRSAYFEMLRVTLVVRVRGAIRKLVYRVSHDSVLGNTGWRMVQRVFASG
jgi:hypothetical protein